MSKIKLTGSNSGYVEISSAADAGNLTLSLPTAGTALLSNAGNVFTGITTFTGVNITDDITFTGASYNVVWDKSDNQLEFGDNTKLSFGASSDLQIFHDGNNSFINEVGSGSLYVRAQNTFNLQKAGTSDFMLKTTTDGAVDLYFANSKKFETTNTGAVVTGICTATSFSGSGEGLTRTTQLSHRNKARNGAMKVSQRGTTFSPTTSDTYLIDGWMTQHGSAGNLDCTVTQSTDAPAGFSKSLKITPDSTNTPSGSQNGMLAQRLEGQDFQDLAFGTSDAKTITVSWYAKTSATGAGNYTVKVEYHSGSANYAVNKLFAFTTTWTRYTYTIPATGTATTNGIVDSNGYGFRIEYHLFSGPDDVASQFTQWTLNPTPTYKVISGQKNFMDNTSNELYITGLQIEVGDIATPFEHRSYGDTLMNCYRYYAKIFTNTSDFPFGVGYKYSAGAHACSVQLPTMLRGTPTCTFDNLRIRGGHTGGSNQEDNVTGIGGMSYSNANFQSFTANTTSNNTSIGQTVVLTNSVSNNTSYIAFDAEL